MSHVLEHALKLAETIRTSHHRHRLEHTLDEFVRLLATVPDYPPGEFSAEEIGALKALAESVIEPVEQQVALNEDSREESRHFVAAVYEIRRLLEEIGRWAAHYRITPTSS